MSAAQVLEMALYDPSEKEVAMTPMTFRVPKTLISEMDAVVRLWKMFAAARGDDPRVIDRSYVMRKLLRDGKESAFDEFGGIPTDESGWSLIETAILKSVKKSR